MLQSDNDGSIRVRVAGPADLPAIDHLIRAAGSVFGFVARVVLARSIELSELLVATDADAVVVGAIRFHHRRDGTTTIHEVVVAAAMRRAGIGRQIVQAAHNSALARGNTMLRAKCPIDEPANGFYRAAGWERVAIEDGRVRKLVLWMLPVRAPIV